MARGSWATAPHASLMHDGVDDDTESLLSTMTLQLAQAQSRVPMPWLCRALGTRAAREQTGARPTAALGESHSAPALAVE